MPVSVIVVRDLSVELGANTVLRSLDLTVEPGEIVAITGVNGSGKSTLLRCLAGLQPATSGTVRVWSTAPDAGPGFWREVGLLAEPPGWYPGLTVREHLELVRLAHRPLPPGLATVDELLAGFGLAARADAIPLTLSTGQRQRLALAALFVRPSRLLLLDEPERGLDAAFVSRLSGTLTGYAAGGGTVLLATHNEVLAGRCATRRVVLAGDLVTPAGDPLAPAGDPASGARIAPAGSDERA